MRASSFLEPLLQDGALLEATFALLDHTPLNIILLDEEGRVIRVNDSTASGIPVDRKRKDALAGDVLRCMHAACEGGCSTGEECECCMVRAAVEDARHGREVVRRYTEFQLQSGETRHVLLSAAPVGGKVLLCVEDVTDLKETERRLRDARSDLAEREQVLRSLYEMVIAGEDMPVTELVDRIAHRLADLLGEGVHVCVAVAGGDGIDTVVKTSCPRCSEREDGSVECRSVFEAMGNVGSTQGRVEIPCHIKREGRVLSVVPMKSAQGVEGVVCIFGDGREPAGEELRPVELVARYAAHRISAERMKWRMALSERMEAVGKLVSGVAHEVRNPLNAILALSAVLKDELAGTEQAEFAEEIGRQVQRLSSLTSELLEFARPLHEEDLKPIVLNDLVEATVKEWRFGRDVRVVVDVPREEIRTVGDAVRLQRALCNLLQNAVQHGGGASEVRVVLCRRDPSMAAVRVVDRGKGIGDVAGERLFDPFYTTRRDGVGLGLSIVKQVAQMHGGGVRAGNNTDGPGAWFEMIIPLRRE